MGVDSCLVRDPTPHLRLPSGGEGSLQAGSFFYFAALWYLEGLATAGRPRRVRLLLLPFSEDEDSLAAPRRRPSPRSMTPPRLSGAAVSAAGARIQQRSEPDGNAVTPKCPRAKHGGRKRAQREPLGVHGKPPPGATAPKRATRCAAVSHRATHLAEMPLSLCKVNLRQAD